MSYLTVEEARDSGISVFKDIPDDALEKMIDHVGKIVDEYCRTRFEPTKSQWITDDKVQLKVPKKPLLSVDSLFRKGIELKEDEDYYVYPDRNRVIIEDKIVRDKKRKTLTLDYVYGYEEVPATVKEIMIELLRARIQNVDNNTKVKSETWDDYSYTLFDNITEFSNILSGLDFYVEPEEPEEEESNGAIKIQAHLL